MSRHISNPADWYGWVETNCYITPKEVCWFPWKKRYDSIKATEFPSLDIHSAVDTCCYNFPEYGDVYYYIPSAPIRSNLGIVDSNGYLYYDDKNEIKAIYSISGEKWRTFQEYLLVEKEELLTALEKKVRI